MKIFCFFFEWVYKPFMPNKRAAGQTVVAFSLDEKLLDFVDHARLKLPRMASRSEFVRLALVAYLEADWGFKMKGNLVSAPDRAVKEPERSAHYLPSKFNGMVLNEGPAERPVVIAARKLEDARRLAESAPGAGPEELLKMSKQKGKVKA